MAPALKDAIGEAEMGKWTFWAEETAYAKVRGGSKTQRYTSEVRRFLLARRGAEWEVRAR